MSRHEAVPPMRPEAPDSVVVLRALLERRASDEPLLANARAARATTSVVPLVAGEGGVTVKIHVGDALSVLRTLPSESVHMAVCSPPYWNLRDYGTALWDGGDAECDHSPDARGGRFATAVSSEQASNAGSGTASTRNCPCGATRIDKQIGLESTPELWCAAMVAVFREVRRVLRPDATCWVNVGDSYAGSCNGRNADGTVNTTSPIANKGQTQGLGIVPKKLLGENLKPKDLIGIPWMLAFALRADGWYLRSEIIWAKPNPMPESVTDRPTKAHEQLFLLSRSRSYYYDSDSIREASAYPDDDRKARSDVTDKRMPTDIVAGIRPGSAVYPMRNKRSVWTVATEGFPGSHFATYPTALIEPCIKAGTSERGVCPECGAPWVRVVEKSPNGHSRLPGAVTGRGNPLSPLPTSPNGQYDHHGESLALYSTVTTGWRPSCKHQSEPVPATVLDPFFGAGTTGLVADRLNRDCIGIELNPEYAAMAQRRINGEAPMFSDVSVA